MRTVHKYPVSLSDISTLDLPLGAEILTVRERGGDAFLYALVSPEAPTERRVFRVANTGEPISERNELRYVGTFRLRDEGLVYHLFEMRTNHE